MAKYAKKIKPFACLECGKTLTFGEAQAASWRGCPKCGGADVDVNPAAGAGPITVAVVPGKDERTFNAGATT